MHVVLAMRKRLDFFERAAHFVTIKYMLTCCMHVMGAASSASAHLGHLQGQLPIAVSGSSCQCLLCGCSSALANAFSTPRSIS